MTSKLSSVGKRLLIQAVIPPKGTLILSNQKPTRFTVCSIGEEVTKVKVGDIIYLDKYSGVEIEHENDKYLVCDESSILAKLD